MFTIDVDQAKSKHCLTEDEGKAVLAYMKANPQSETAMGEMMKKYNCTQMSIMTLIVNDLGAKRK